MGACRVCDTPGACRAARGLFFDDDIVWHRQHFGLIGQVAVASVAVRGRAAYTAVHHSDLVQRISRRRDLKTRVEKEFRGWDRMLLNGIVAFAAELGLETVKVPTSEAASRQTDQSRRVMPELFERVYDRHIGDRFDVRRDGPWWTIDIAPNRARIVFGERRQEPVGATNTICVCHDLERGAGHRDMEPAFAAHADKVSTSYLDRMLEVEHAAGVRATYNVVGAILPEVRSQLEADEHCVGFHTYDHTSPVRRWPRAVDRTILRRSRAVAATHSQLSRCRRVDYRIKGYRPAQSKLGWDTDERLLASANFEWLASSAHSFGFERPTMNRGIVKIPLLFDDFSLHRGEPYERWARRAIDAARDRSFLAFSLHDCYGASWLGGYSQLLHALRDLGEIRTLDEVAAEVTLSNAV